jgi:hypothetical protein
MNIKNKITKLILVKVCSLASIAQVGIGRTITPFANAALDLADASQGMLFMTTALRNTSPCKIPLAAKVTLLTYTPPKN